MGQNLSDAVMLVMTPDAWCYDKHALSHVAKFADDTTGPVVEDDGTVCQGRIGFIPRIPEEQFDTPWWACYGHSLRECIDNLCESGWLRSVGDDGAYELNVNRLVRMIDIEETSIAQNQHIIPEKYDEEGNRIAPPSEWYADPLFEQFVDFAGQLMPGDFGAPLCDDVSAHVERNIDATVSLDRDNDWEETNPARWTRAILDWKDLTTEDGFRLPEQWVVGASDRSPEPGFLR